MLVNGKWTADWQPIQAKDAAGGFVRQTSTFRNWVTADGRPGPTGAGGFPAEAGRYRLYVGLICPWASRTLAARALMGLEDAIPVTVVDPVLGAQGWRFGPAAPMRDEEIDATWMHEIYTAADPAVNGRATVPVLWDRARRTIVNNESADILRMLGDGFRGLAAHPVDLYPEPLRADIDALSERIYPALNNGVYRAGFASTQGAYEAAYRDVFAMLDDLEARLSGTGPYLFGAALTETDIRLFVTLVRFDAAYHGLFKCNRRRLADYAQLSAYLDRLMAVPALAGTVSIDHIKRGYYGIGSLNPNGIVPLGPDLPFPDKAAAFPGT